MAATATDSFINAQTEAIALAERIAKGLDQYNAGPTTEMIHWGHAGDMAKYRADLQQISDRLFFEGEYAPEGK